MYSCKSCWLVSRIVVLVIGIALFCAVRVAAEEDANENGTVTQLSEIDTIQQEIEKIDERIRGITLVKSDQVAEEFGVGVEDISQRLYDLGLLKSSFERLRNAIVALEKIEKDKQAVKDRYESYRAKGMPQKPPYTLSFLDAMHEELSTAERNQQNIDLTIELLRQEPFVLFSDFGDNALLFNVYFWVGIKRVIERRQIESDVRFKIDALFAEEGIVIAFPQRDVHLDTSRPLHIELTEKRIN